MCKIQIFDKIEKKKKKNVRIIGLLLVKLKHDNLYSINEMKKKKNN